MQLSATDALVHVMVMAAVSDKDVTDSEMDRFAALISRWPVFESFDIERLPEVASSCVETVNKAGSMRFSTRSHRPWNPGCRKPPMPLPWRSRPSISSSIRKSCACWK